MNKVAIVTSGYLPVPATKGGGVEVLDEYLIKENELEKKLNMTIYSSYDDEAAEQSKQFKHTKIEFIKTPLIFKLMDKGTYWFAKNILKKVKPNSYRYIFQRLHFLNSVSKKLSIEDFDKVVLENHATLFSVIKKHKNYDKYKGKYYFHLHNEVTNDFGNAYYIENCTKVLGVSNYINSTLKKRFPNMKEEQFTVLRNAVDHERFALELTETEKNLIRKQYGMSKEDVVFLFSGRLTEEKGIVEALKAFKLANLDNAKFLVVGSSFFATDVKSQFEIQLESLIKEMGNQVIFTGFIPNNQMGKIYSIADVSVLPSIWDDPAPLTIIESITAGKAIITTDSGGIPEYVTSKNAIVLKRDKNIVKSIADSMKLIKLNYKYRNKMEFSSKVLSENLTIKRFYDDMIKLILGEFDYD